MPSNYMTEDEARGKCCPMALAGYNKMECGASECMAWRWLHLSCGIDVCPKEAECYHCPHEKYSNKGYCGMVKQ